MRNIVRFLATVAKIALAAAAFAPRLVWESGKWISKNVFGSGAGGGAVAAQAQAAAELQAAAEEVAHAHAAPAAAEPASPVGTPDWIWGTAALHVLAEGREAGEGILDESSLAYLTGLSAEQGLRLAAFSPDWIGRHLTGNEPIRSLPQAGSPHSYWAAEIQRLCAETDKIVPILRVDENAGLEEARRAAYAYSR
jgi:hypothetical protein